MADTYINLSGHNIYSWETLANTGPLYNIPASRFLRPFNPKLKALDALRLQRIKNDMTAAAQKNALYHLWWHPHNFGIHRQENLSFLKSILQHHRSLQQQYGFLSMTMSEVAAYLPEHYDASSKR